MLFRSQMFPQPTQHDILLLVEELLRLYSPHLKAACLDLTVAFSEKSERLQILCRTEPDLPNPLEAEEEDLGAIIVRNMSEQVTYDRATGTSTLEITLRPHAGLS